jgi:hypothetical protein
MGVKVAFREPAADASEPLAKSVVPQAAVAGDDGRQVVFVVDDGAVERRAVTAGRSLGSYLEIMAGVSPGERLAVTGLEQLSDGMRVNVRQ